MEIVIAIVVTAILVTFVVSKLNSGLRFEETCAEQIQNAFLANGTPLELGMARLMLRNGVDLINHINEKDGNTVYISLRRAREISVTGILHSLETGAEPLEAIAAAYSKSKAS